MTRPDEHHVNIFMLALDVTTTVTCYQVRKLTDAGNGMPHIAETLAHDSDACRAVAVSALPNLSAPCDLQQRRRLPRHAAHPCAE